MKSKSGISTLAFVLLFLGIALSGYLVPHHYQLIYGMREGKSFCSIGPHMDCDAVNVSSYSEIFGIPVALFAVFAMGVELILLFGYRVFSEDEKQKLARFFFYLASVNLAGMAGFTVIQLAVLKLFCILCSSFALISLILFVCAWKMVDGPKFANVANDLKRLFLSSKQNGSRGVLILLLVIPVGAVFANMIYKQNISKDLDRFVAESVSSWQSGEVHNISIGTAPQVGNPSAGFQIVEFSDFQCPHCKRAAPSLHAFVNSHLHEVHFTFQNYPLDPNCNPKIPAGGGHDKACLMARASFCALKQNKFTEAHDWIFSNQDGLGDSSPQDMCAALGLDKTAFLACMSDAATRDEIQKEVDQGNLAGVQGTPTVFVNGKILPGGFVIPILEATLKLTSK